MFQKGLKFYRSLTFKILLYISCTIIPINVLTIYLSNSLVSNFEIRLLESYENELALYMTKIDEELNAIQNSMNEIMRDNWVELAMGEQSNETSIERFAFWTELQTSRKNLDMVEAAYLRTNWEEQAYITADSNKCDVKERYVLQKYLSSADFSGMKPGDVVAWEIEGHYYLIKNYNCFTYSFGYVLNIEELLEPLKEVSAFESEVVLLCDAKGQLLGTEWKIDVQKTEQLVEQQGTDLKMITISYPSEQMDYSLVRIFQKKDLYYAIPIVERIIQALGLMGILILPFIWYQLHKLVLRPLKKLDEAMKEIENENLEYRIEPYKSSLELEHINGVFNHMASQIKELTIEAYEKDIEKLEIEATNLRLQINPHMLLNSLNMIYSLSQSKNYQCIQDFTMNLVQYFRYALRKTDDFVTLKAEMDFVKSYLEIQKIRFPGAFSYTYDMEEELASVEIPPLLIENFVENSIKYALKLGSEIEILIIMKQMEEFLSISIIDTGNGMSEEVLEQLKQREPIVDRTGKHIGIWNCRRRLKMYYGELAELNISSFVGEGTQVFIKLPIHGK